MIPITITPDIERAPWTDLREALKSQGGELGSVTRIGRLPRGTQSGASTVTVVIELPDGRQVVGQTTMALFQGAARALKAADEEASGSSSRN